MADLFVSYASPDREVVAHLVREFERQGWTVWWDRHIQIGHDFDRKIEEALDESLCIVVVWSEHSINSSWVRAEAAEGLERNVLVPVLLDDVKPPLLFRQKQAISLVGWKPGGSVSLGDLLPSIQSTLDSYARSSLPISTQRSWALGRARSAPQLDRLAHAVQTALTIGLSYFEDVFVYASDFRGKSAYALDFRQLEDLARDEGLDGYLFAEIDAADDDVVLSLHIQPLNGERITRSTRCGNETAVLAELGRCLSACSEALQGKATFDATPMLAYLQRLDIGCLNQYWFSFQYAADNDYAKVLEACQRALEFDGRFAHAYSAAATACAYLGREVEARQTIAKAIDLLENESRRNALRMRALYFAIYSEDYEKAGREFEELVHLSPLDEMAINNLAVSCFYQLRFDRARELSARDLALYPMKHIARQNAAFYALYAGELDEADRLAESLFLEQPSYVNCQVIRALVRAERGDEDEADELYASALDHSERSDSILLQGMADLAMARGDWRRADELLGRGIGLDRDLANGALAARKHLMKAEVALSQSDGSSRGLEHIADALDHSDSTATLASAGLVCARFALAMPPLLEKALKRKVNAHGRAYAKMVSGCAASAAGDLGAAVELLNDAVEIADLWLIRLARAFIFTAANLPLEAREEARICLARPGEALSAALDEQPTYRYLVSARHASGR